ncbi:MAG TPA: ornithine carbamoyltransferase [bacterium]|nr:ornithine carbamoyltransferase [bacterium]
MNKRDLTYIPDLSREDVRIIFGRSAEMKKDRTAYAGSLAGKVMALISEKQSLRTRVTFETGMYQLGGYSIYLSNHDISLGKREPVIDIARNLERWVDVIVARVFKQESIIDLAKYSSVPVINALSDMAHPCQALADLFTLEWLGHDLKGFPFTYIGDGNNVCHSLMLLSGLTGVKMTVSTPEIETYMPNKKIFEQARALARESGGEIIHEPNPGRAVQGAKAVYTDVWASMGQEKEAEIRKQVFAKYQVNAALLSQAEPGAYVMHCLPAHRGEEITDEAMESEQSIVFEQAENRLHTQKAILHYLMLG